MVEEDKSGAKPGLLESKFQWKFDLLEEGNDGREKSKRGILGK